VTSTQPTLLVIHGRRDGADYEALEQVYHDKLEAQNMLETAIARERALIFAQGEAEGIAKGKAEGIAEGKAEGIAEGEAIGSANFLISLLEKRFGSLTPEQQLV